MKTLLLRLLAEDDGPTAVEYAVVLSLIVGVCIASVNLMAQGTADSFEESATQLSGVLGS